MATVTRAPEQASPSCVAIVAEGQWHVDLQPLDPGPAAVLRTRSCASTAETVAGDERRASTAYLPGARVLDEHVQSAEKEPPREAAPEAEPSVAPTAISTSLSLLAVSVAALCWLGVVLKGKGEGVAQKPAALTISILLRRTETLAHYTYHHGASGLDDLGIDALFEHMIVGSQL